MNKINWFYISLLIITVGLGWVLFPRDEDDVAFFGFAENLETEINYNYSVRVDSILVTPGEAIEEGKALILLSREKAKEQLSSEPYEIITLQRELAAWQQKQASKKLELKIEYQEKIEELDLEIEKLRIRKEENDRFRSTVLKDSSTSDTFLVERIKQLTAQKKQLDLDLVNLLNAVEEESRVGSEPFYAQMTELRAKEQFTLDHKIQSIIVEAPEAGIIGNINCREGEHIPGFKTLMTFYEPHPTLVKGYVHEESLIHLGEEAEFEVSSLLYPEKSYPGKLIGMGSRIVEIPSRLRKFPQIKSYGREISLEIPAENHFLQKEKVSVKIIRHEEE